MNDIVKEFLHKNLDNIIWGAIGGVAIIATAWFTDLDMTAMIGAFIGICINKMRGSNGVVKSIDPEV